MPSTLQAKIKDLPADIQVAYCYIVSKVVIETKKHPAMFVSISSVYFKDLIGSEYRGFLEQLREWSIIEINDAYSNNEGSKFCKSYRLHSNVRAASKVKISFQKKQIHPLRDKSELTTDIARFVYNNLKRLTVRTEPLTQANVIDEVDSLNWAEQIYFQAFDVHYSAHAKRLYHAAILMPRVARKNLILKADAAVPLFEYDIKSCMPVILLGLVQDSNERNTLIGLLDGDIYMAIASESGVRKNRAEIKVDFLKFLNGAVRNYVYAFFHVHLPNLAERVMRGRGAERGMAWFGQVVEAEIMVQKVPSHLMQPATQPAPTSTNQSTLSLTCGGNSSELLYIPMHDGWLGIEQDEQRITSVVRNEFHRRLGYWVTITKTRLETGTETILISAEPET